MHIFERKLTRIVCSLKNGEPSARGRVAPVTNNAWHVVRIASLYNPPSASWSFVPPAPAGPQNSSGGSATHSGAGSSSSIIPNPSSGQLKWSSRPAHNSVFDLSPSLDPNDPSGHGLDIKILLPAALASALLQYTSTALAMPWEVGRVLLQVQWVPRDVGEIEPTVTELVPGDEVYV